MIRKQDVASPISTAGAIESANMTVASPKGNHEACVRKGVVGVDS